MKPSLLQRALLILGSTMFSLLLGEAAVRCLAHKPVRADRSAIDREREMRKTSNRDLFQSLHRADPMAGWTLGPRPAQFHHRLFDKQGVVQYDVSYSINSGHRRTAAVPHEGPVLIAAGCSFTFGHGLNDQDTWPWLLQEKLPDYQVVNTADLGYGTDQALLVAEREVRRHPDQKTTVILGFGDFQIERNRAPQGWMVSVYPYSKPLFAVHAGMVEYQRQVRFVPGGVFCEYSDLLGLTVNAFANRMYHIPSHDEAKELTAALIINYAKRLNVLGGRLVVTTLPYNGDNSPLSKGDRAYIAGRLQAAGIPVMTADFPRGADGSIDIGEFMVSRIDRHPNRRYNTALSDQMLPFLQNAGVLARPDKNSD